MGLPLEKTCGAKGAASQDCWPPKPDLAINRTCGEVQNETGRQIAPLLFCAVMNCLELTTTRGPESFTRSSEATTHCAINLQVDDKRLPNRG